MEVVNTHSIPLKSLPLGTGHLHGVVSYRTWPNTIISAGVMKLNLPTGNHLCIAKQWTSPGKTPSWMLSCLAVFTRVQIMIHQQVVGWQQVNMTLFMFDHPCSFVDCGRTSVFWIMDWYCWDGFYVITFQCLMALIFKVAQCASYLWSAAKCWAKLCISMTVVTQWRKANATT